jgi:hypothetical protein
MRKQTISFAGLFFRSWGRGFLPTCWIEPGLRYPCHMNGNEIRKSAWGEFIGLWKNLKSAQAFYCKPSTDLEMPCLLS